MVRAESAIRPHEIVIRICHHLSRPISPRADFLAFPWAVSAPAHHGPRDPGERVSRVARSISVPLRAAVLWSRGVSWNTWWMCRRMWSSVRENTERRGAPAYSRGSW